MMCKRYIERDPNNWMYNPIPFKRNCREFIQYKITNSLFKKVVK